MAIKTKVAVVENTTLEIKGLSSSILVSSQIINDTTACCSEFKPPCPPLKVNTLYFPAANSTGTAHGNQPPCLLLPWQMRQPFVWWRTCSKKKKAILAAGRNSPRISDRVFPVKPCQWSISSSCSRKSQLCAYNQPHSTPSRRSCCCFADAANINFHSIKTKKLHT